MRSLIGRLAGLAIAIVVFTQFNPAEAVPAYARQTGLDCTTCHMSWLELTNIGRRFKLGGYQLMKAMAPDVLQKHVHWYPEQLTIDPPAEDVGEGR